MISIIKNIRIITLLPCLDARFFKQIIEESSYLSTFFPLIIASHRFPKPAFFKITKEEILNNFVRILKSYYIIPLSIFIPVDPFDPILKFA